MPREKKKIKENYISTRDSNNLSIIAKRQTYFFSDLQIAAIKLYAIKEDVSKNAVMQQMFSKFFKDYPDILIDAEKYLKKKVSKTNFSSQNSIEKNEKI